MASGILKLKVVVVVAVILLAVTPKMAGAQTYNCGAYGSGDYNENCPAAASSGTGSSGGFDTVVEGGKIILNDFPEYFETDGKDLALKVGQIIYFTVEVNGVVEEHTATVKEIGADYVVLVFGPLFSELRMDVGQTVHADVTGDDRPDITIKLNRIVSDTGFFTFRQYVAETPSIPDKQLPEQGQQSKSTSVWQYVGIVVAFGLIIVAALWAIRTKARSRAV